MPVCIYMQRRCTMYFILWSDSQIQRWYTKIICIVIYRFIGKQLIKTNSANPTPKKIQLIPNLYVAQWLCHLACIVEKMCRVKQWVLRIWGTEKIYFRCSLLWINGPFLAVVPSGCISGTQLSGNYAHREPSSCTAKQRPLGDSCQKWSPGLKCQYE